MKILCIGHAAYDITIPVSKYPEENKKHRVERRVECGGGPASNAAYLLGKWGLDTYFAGVIGNDEYGRVIKAEFESVGVNTKYLELKDGFKTTSSFILANSSNGSRTVFTYRPEEVKMKPFELDFEPTIILLDGQEPEISMELINKYPASISIIDAGRPKPEIMELAKRVDYLVCSKDYAEAVTGISIDYSDSNSYQSLFDALKNQYKNEIIVTLEDKGCLYEIDGDVKRMPSIEVNPIDSTGAGDIFHGAFTYALAKNFPLEDMLKVSNITGAMSVTRIGGRFSVPHIEEVMRAYHAFK